MSEMSKSWKEIVRDQQGGAVIEVTAIIPIILFMIGAICLFSIFLTDMAAVKGQSIYVADNVTKDKNDDLEQAQLLLAQAAPYDTKKKLNQIVVTTSLQTRLPWRGLKAYMPIDYRYQMQTKTARDNRKEWLWTYDLIK